MSDTVPNESTYEVTVRYTTTERSDDVYVIDKGDEPDVETTTDRELWISRGGGDDADNELVAVYARDVWACVWVREIPPPTDGPQDDREYHP